MDSTTRKFRGDLPLGADMGGDAVRDRVEPEPSVKPASVAAPVTASRSAVGVSRTVTTTAAALAR